MRTTSCRSSRGRSTRKDCWPSARRRPQARRGSSPTQLAPRVYLPPALPTAKIARSLRWPRPRGGVGRWGLFLGRPVGALGGVLDPPCLDGLPRVLRRCEPVPGEVFGTAAAVERLREGVVAGIPCLEHSSCAPFRSAHATSAFEKHSGRLATVIRSAPQPSASDGPGAPPPACPAKEPSTGGRARLPLP